MSSAIMFILTVLSATFVLHANSQVCTPEQFPKVLVPNGLPGDEAGLAIALGNDTLAVGSKLANRDGEVNIFTYANSTATHVQRLLSPLGADSNRFGAVLDIDGSTLIVGSFNETAYVYSFDEFAWHLTDILTASDGIAADRFGESVALWGDTLAIGAVGDSDRGSRSGSVYIFKRVQGRWLETQKLTAPDGSEGAIFGASVDLWGNRLIVGAPFDSLTGFRGGAAYVFEEIDGTMSLTSTIRPSDLQVEDHFGAKVGVYGDTLIASTWRDEPFNLLSGSAYVFHFTNSTWFQVDELRAGGTDPVYFGQSIAAGLGKLAISAPRDDDDAAYSGAVYIYSQVGRGWVLDNKLKADQPGKGDNFGNAVSLHQDTVAVGAPEHTALGSRSGATYIYTLNCPAICIADVNGDGVLDESDLNDWVASYFAGSAVADQNGDGYITPADFSAWIANFNNGCDSSD